MDHRDEQAVRAHGFRARAMTFPGRTAFPRHQHRGGHVVLVYDGEWTDHAGSHRCRLGQGDILFHPAHIEHETAAAAGTTVVIIDIAHSILAPFCGLYGNHLHPILLAFEDVEGIPERIHKEVTHPDEASPLVVNALILQILATGSRVAVMPAHRKPAWMSKLISHIHANLGERLTIRRLASSAAVSESHLSHAFIRYFHCSVSDYIRDLRLREAARALRHTNDSIQEIAWKTGFADQAHFSRTFKASYRTTPTEYRSARA